MYFFLTKLRDQADSLGVGMRGIQANKEKKELKK